MMPHEQLPSLAGELFVERDRILRTFCQALQAKDKILDELAEEFDASVRQIAARKALRKGLSGDAINEVVSETMVRFFGAIVSGRFVPQDAPVAAYISRQAGWIAINLEERTGVRRRREVPFELVMGERPAWSGKKNSGGVSRPVEEIVERRLRVEEAEAAIERLNPYQAEVMRMAANYSREEICERLGLTDSALRNVFYRSRKEIKQGVE